MRDCLPTAAFLSPLFARLALKVFDKDDDVDDEYKLGDYFEDGDNLGDRTKDPCNPQSSIIRLDFEKAPELLWLRCLDAIGKGSEVLLELRDDADDKPEN